MSPWSFSISVFYGYYRAIHCSLCSGNSCFEHRDACLTEYCNTGHKIVQCYYFIMPNLIVTLAKSPSSRNC